MVSVDRKLPQLYIEAALDKLAGWCPSEALTLQEHRKEIVNHIMTGTEPRTGSALRCVPSKDKHSRSPCYPALTPSQEAMSVVVADAISFVTGLFGLQISDQERLMRVASRELGTAK